ncbi:MAG: phosphoribosylglycinamide formyltransferase [Alphaproteobacteria bacterium]|nr:phosphoribosylglycinamide formyltransferase [Alphaproteobacteria bacterium]
MRARTQAIENTQARATRVHGKATTLLRVAVFVSGRGSNLKALLQAAQQSPEDYPYDIVAVCSDQHCPAIDFARQNGIATHSLDPEDRIINKSSSRKIAEDSFLRNVDTIALAGFMRILRPDFLADWTGKVVNIHPSLLPKFPGLNTHARAIKAGENSHGCTVHFVDAGVDTGLVIAQTPLKIAKDDTHRSLATRVLHLEHLLYCFCLAAVAKSKIKLKHQKLEAQLIDIHRQLNRSASPQALRTRDRLLPLTGYRARGRKTVRISSHRAGRA